MLRKIVSHSIVALLLTGVAAGLTGSSGCASRVDQPAPSSSAETVGRIEAHPETRAETGIDGWIVTRDGAGVLLDGKTAEGVSIHQVRLQSFSLAVSENGRSDVLTGVEISSSSGGLVRYTRDGRVLDFEPDGVALKAFARDIEALRRGDVTYTCSIISATVCAGGILSAIAACGGPVNIGCIGAILSAFGCFECFCEQFGCDTGGGGGGGGGTGGGPGDDCIDCGDGRLACPPQVCP